jgi:3D (Asp-Asp-Asp) domain-containing protein
LLLVVTFSSSHVLTAKAAEIAVRPAIVGRDAPTAGFVVPDKSFGRKYIVDSTAYTSSVEECDGDPFITADGSTTRDGIIAANFLPFNTKVRIPELFGDKVFEVHDRMNARYLYRVDVWMEKKTDMRQYGIHHNVTIEIVQMGDGKKHWGEKN